MREDSSLDRRQEQYGDRSGAEVVWYYAGLLELFEYRRPGPLTEDLRRAVAELAPLVARDRVADASQSAASVTLDWPRVAAASRE